jgi:YfiH family protein
MQENRIGELSFLSYSNYETHRNVTNVVTTRVGGKSAAPYESLNLALHVGDKADTVLENRARLAQALGLEPEALTVPEQVHKIKVSVVKNAHRGRGAVTEEDALPKADAMVTNVPEIPLMVLIADCVALSFYDRKRNVIGLAHAGWRGTLEEIAVETVRKMEKTFGCEPEDIIVGISPSIGRGHYEIGEDVSKAFIEKFGRGAAREFVEEDMDGTCYLDLWAANEYQLREHGIHGDNILIAEMCTACHPDKFYSHRHENGKTGRVGAIMMLHSTTTRQY